MKHSAVLTGLAGAAAVAGASQAYGSVVNVTLPANVVGHAPASTDNGTRVNLDLNGDGQRDLSIVYRNLLTSNNKPFLLSYIFAGTAAVPGSTVGSYIYSSSGSNQAYAFALTAGYKVGPNSGFYQNASFLTHLVTNYNGTNYGFTNYLGKAGSQEFVGFKFQTTGGQTDYGFISLETDPYVSAANPGGIKFFQISYENTGAAITITNAVPEPGTLAALAMGAAACAGIGLKRRRAAAAQA